MLKKAIALAVAAAALAALAVPATASATWTKNHEAIQKNEQGTVHGQLKFEGEIGSVECPSTVAGQLIAGTTTANIDQLHVDLAGKQFTERCKIAGGLVSVGCTGTGNVVPSGLPWVAHATGTQQITVTTGVIQFTFHGGIFCPKTIQLTPGTMTINAAAAFTFGAAQLGGTAQADLSNGSKQNMTISGSGTVTPAGSFGIS